MSSSSVGFENSGKTIASRIIRARKKLVGVENIVSDLIKKKRKWFSDSMLEEKQKKLKINMKILLFEPC